MDLKARPKASSSVLTTLLNYLINSFSPGSEQRRGVCVGVGVGMWAGGGGVHMCECTVNKWSTKLYLYHCLSHFPSHGHQLGLQKQMFRENLRHKMFINPCEGKGKEAELSREEPNCKEGPAKPQSGSRESGAHMGHPGNHQGLSSWAFFHPPCSVIGLGLPHEGQPQKRQLCSQGRP